MHPNDRTATSRPLPSVAEALRASTALSSCWDSISRAGLAEMLQQGGSFTIFAPTDGAFQNLPPEIAEELRDPARLREVLEYHVVVGLDASRPFTNSKLKTMQGTLLTEGRTDDGMTVDHANACGHEIRCANGVIQPIDAVLLPGFTRPVSAEAKRESAWSGRRGNRPPPKPIQDW